MNLFICTMPVSYIDDYPLKPLQIALISEDGKYSFYAQITDFLKVENLNSIVNTFVIQLMTEKELNLDVDRKNIHARMTMQQCRDELTKWLCQFQDNVRLMSYDINADWGVIAGLFYNHPWPQNLLKNLSDHITIKVSDERKFDVSYYILMKHMGFKSFNMYDSVRLLAGTFMLTE